MTEQLHKLMKVYCVFEYHTGESLDKIYRTESAAKDYIKHNRNKDLGFEEWEVEE